MVGLGPGVQQVQQRSVSHVGQPARHLGLFNPLDPDDSSTLGAYRLWWFTRNPGFAVYVPADRDQGGNWGSCDRDPSAPNGFDCG